jgi:hypothetical protein
VPAGVDQYKKSIFKKKKKSPSSDLGLSGPYPGRWVKIASPGGSRRRVEVAMPGRGHAPGGCAAMEDGAEGSMEAVRVEAVVGASGGGSHGGWSRGSVEDGGACHRGEGSHHRRSGEGSCRCCRGRRWSRPRILVSDVLTSGILTLLPVSCTRGVRRPHIRRPRVVAGEMYSRLPASSCRRPRALAVIGSSTGCS